MNGPREEQAGIGELRGLDGTPLLQGARYALTIDHAEIAGGLPYIHGTILNAPSGGFPASIVDSEVLRRNPDWKLSVEGHTDAIASEQYNLDLSARRAAAVRTALGSRFGIAAARLTTAGLGESSPRDRNDTLEGRARNRRVELVRR